MDEMTPAAPAAPKTHIQFGILAAAIGIVLFLVYYLLDIPQRGWEGYIPSLVFVGIIITAQFSHAKALEGNITYGNLFASGFKTAAVTTCITVLFYIILLLVYPPYKAHMLELSRQQLASKGTLSADQIDTAMKMTSRFFGVFVVGGAVFGSLLVGCIGSLIGAALPKKNPKPQSPFHP